MRAGPRRLRRHNRLLARALCSVAPALRPSFLRRPRDHGRSSRETDQDQNWRGEAVRSRQRLLSLASCGPRGWAACRPEAAAGLQASPGARGRGRDGRGSPVPEPAGRQHLLRLSPKALLVERRGWRQPRPSGAAVGEQEGRWPRSRGRPELWQCPCVRAPRGSPPTCREGGGFTLSPALRWTRKPVLKFRGYADSPALIKNETSSAPGHLTWQAGLAVFNNWGVNFQHTHQTSVG